MADPKFTILTATFNAGSALNVAAASVRAQGRKDVEFIVIDGGSTDDTLTYVHANRDVVTSFISERDEGIYDAVNKGIALARGELIGIIGADDGYVVGALNSVEYFHSNAPADIYAGLTLQTGPDGVGMLRLDEDYGPASLVSGIPFGHNAMFVHRDTYQALGGYDKSYRIAADAEWVHRAIRSGRTCTRIPRVLTQFSSSGVSSVDAEGILRESGRVIRGNFPFLTQEEALKCLYCVRGWANATDLLPILQSHTDPNFFDSLRSAFQRMPTVWTDLMKKLERSGGSMRATNVSHTDKLDKPAPVAKAQCAEPVFSFIIPAYNVEKYILRCLRSIISQPFEHIEIIVVDDGSTDSTASIVRDLQTFDKRVHLVQQTNQGQGAARAAALAFAGGTYVWFVDSDDYIQDNVLHRISGIFDKSEADVVVLNYAYENEDGSIEYSTLVPSWLGGRTVKPTQDERTFAALACWTCPPWRYIIRNSYLRDKKIQFISGYFYEDHPFSIDLMTQTDRVYVDTTISYFYLRRSGSTVRSSDRRCFDFLEMRRQSLKRLAGAGLAARFPSLATSYIIPLSFIKSHVGRAYRSEFLDRIFEDMSEAEVAILRSGGSSGDLAVLESYKYGTLHSLELDAIESNADSIGSALEISRSLPASDVRGLGDSEGPYPEVGLPNRFRWVVGDKLHVRVRRLERQSSVLYLRYRNSRPGQIITAEQSNRYIESYPCRHSDLSEIAELSIPVHAGSDVTEVALTMRKFDDSSGRRLSIIVEQLELLDRPASSSATAAILPTAGVVQSTVRGRDSNIASLSVDVRVDPQPRSYVFIGDESDVAGTIVFERGVGEVHIGSRSSIGHGSLIICSQEQGITIGSNVMLSWGVTVIDTDSHSLNPKVRANDAYDWLVGVKTGQLGRYKDWANVRCAPITIKDGAWIGFHSTILKGVTVGYGAVVACNSVVTKDVPDYTIVAGNPARIVGSVPLDEAAPPSRAAALHPELGLGRQS